MINTAAREALIKIANGDFPNASRLAVAGDWQGLLLEAQKIAKKALALTTPTAAEILKRRQQQRLGQCDAIDMIYLASGQKLERTDLIKMERGVIEPPEWFRLDMIDRKHFTHPKAKA